MNSKINSGNTNELVEGVYNSSIVPTNPPVSAWEGLASEMSFFTPAVISANAENANEQMEGECVHSK